MNEHAGQAVRGAALEPTSDAAAAESMSTLRLLDLRVFEGACLPVGRPLIRLTLSVPELQAARRQALADTVQAALLNAATATGGDHRLRAAAIRERGAGGASKSEGADSGDEGVSANLALVAARAALTLQQLLGFDVDYAVSPDGGVPGRGVAVMSYKDAAMSVQAVQLVVELLAALLRRGAEDDREAADEIARRPVRRYFHGGYIRDSGGTIGLIVAEAERRGIPWFRAAGNPGIVQLGQGPKIQRFAGWYTRNTSYLGWRTCNHKQHAAAVLRDHGLPGARNRMVGSAEQAVAAAQGLGYPVVVKPNNTDFGTAVSVDLQDAEAVRTAYDMASAHGQVLVEKYIAGDHFRLIVMNGTLVTAARYDPAQVIGDGQSNVRDLVLRTNNGRSDFISDHMKRIALDDKARHVLEMQGLTFESVPEQGRRVLLRGNSNLSEGGTFTNVSHLVHPENRGMAERAARIFDIDVCGIDYLTNDISQPYHETGGGICEVNAAPASLVGDGPDMGRLWLDSVYPPGDDGRIPTTVVLGGAIGAPVARALAAIQGEAGRVTGCATWQDARIAGKRIVTGDCTGPESGRLLLRDPGVEAAVFESNPHKVAEQGLPLDRCSVAVVPASRSLETGKAGEETQTLRFRVKQMLIACTDRAVVLEASDPDFARLREQARDLPVYAVSLESAADRQAEPFRRHLQQGGRGVVLEKEDDGYALSLHEDGRRIRLMASTKVSSIQLGTPEDQVRVACFTMAGALALGLPVATIASVLTQIRA